jgi:hypothetical protein
MKRIFMIALLAFFGTTSLAAAQSGFRNAVPFEFDPGGSELVQAEWLQGIGCPNSGPFADAGCPTGGVGDFRRQGLLLAKTGPTANNASAGASLRGADGETVRELGYDIRKGGAPGSAIGSHCGAGAPRFNVTTDFGTHFVGCASPPGTVTAASAGWTRLRWGPAQAFPPIPPTAPIRSLAIVFDEGQDTGPDFFGLAVIDNIDVNGVLVGKAGGA